MQGYDRDKAFSMQVPEGTGALIKMLASGDIFEVFKEDCIAQIITPEMIDPDYTNPKIPPNRKLLYSDIGSANCIVARIYLQANELCDDLLISHKINKTQMLGILRECRDTLINAYKISDSLCYEIMELTNGYLNPEGKNSKVAIIPHVEDLVNKVHNFTTSIKRCLQAFGTIFNLVFEQNFEGHHYHKIQKYVSKELGENNNLTQLLLSSGDSLRQLIQMRNDIEHPRNNNKLEIKNYEMEANGGLAQPTWQHHPYGERTFITWEMPQILAWVINFIETATVYLLLSQVEGQIKFRINIVEEENYDLSCPIRITATPIIPDSWFNTESIKD